MALSRYFLPSILGRDWWDSWDYPERIMDQCFGTELMDSDLLPPTFYRGYLLRPRTQASISSSGQSEVKIEKDKFKVNLNVSQFKPEELEVKVVDNYVVIHGKHEEKSDEHGFVSREFSRKYMLPEGTEPDKLTSSLNTDGVLMIEAPRKVLELPEKSERAIPISMQEKKDSKKK